MTSEMVAKQGGIQEVLFGLAVAMTESERKIHNKNEDTNSKQATSNNSLLVINNWGTTHHPTKTTMTLTSTPKIKDDLFFDDYSVIQQYQAEQQLINEEDKSKGRSNESNNRSRVKSRSRKVDNTVTQKVKSATSKRMNKSSSKKHTRRYLTSSTYSSDRQQSGSSSSDSSRSRSKSPQHPRMSTFYGTGKPSW